jgi:hypothetical protein
MQVPFRQHPLGQGLLALHPQVPQVPELQQPPLHCEVVLHDVPQTPPVQA